MTTRAVPAAVGPVLPSPVEKVVIPVSGMTCAACQGRVQRTLGKTPGVVEANVNLMTNSATVSFDPGVVDASAIVARIRDTGYGADLPVPGRTAAEEQEAQDAARRAEFAELRHKAIGAGVAGIIAMIVSMPLMAAMRTSAWGGAAIRSCSGRCGSSIRRCSDSCRGRTPSPRRG